jgi:2-desacetyl-2-hydroxyethyl bacteriochlorophyllide A dehydrogenase
MTFPFCRYIVHGEYTMIANAGDRMSSSGAAPSVETMPGIVFLGDRRLDVRQFPVPDPAPDEVVVKVRASGMCGSDLHLYRAQGFANPEVIQGHEPCGEVYALGSEVSGLTPGQRVMVHHYWGCGSCPDCRAGWSQMCRVSEVKTLSSNAHGGHAPYLCVPARTLLPLSDGLSFKAGAAIGCGVGTAWGALARLDDFAGRTLVIFGQGPVGLAATMLASAAGASVIAVDIEAGRLSEARGFGARATVNPSEEATRDAILELTDGTGASHVLDTSGAARAASDAIAVLAPWGRACFVGLGSEVKFTMFDVLKSQMTLMTSWTLSTYQQQQCAEFVEFHDLPVDRLFSHSWTIEEAADAYAWFDRQDAGKGVIEF